MPHTKSAEKRLRQSEKRRIRNKATIKGIKKQTKEFVTALAGTDAAAKATALGAVASKLDKAAARGVIHKNKAARLKSKAAKRLATAAAGGTTKAAKG